MKKLFSLLLICCASINLHSADTSRKLADVQTESYRPLYNDYMGEIIRERELMEKISDSIDTNGSAEARTIKTILPLYYRPIPGYLILDEELGYIANSKGEIFKDRHYQFNEDLIAWRKNSATRELPAIKERNDLLERVISVDEVRIIESCFPNYREERKIKKWDPAALTVDELKTKHYRRQIKQGFQKFTSFEELGDAQKTAWYAYEIDPIVNEDTGAATAALRITSVAKVILQ